jgi:hypothetical protein
MKIIFKNALVVVLMAITSTVYGQSNRMKRDVAVMETVLEQLIKEKRLRMGYDKAEANYFQNFGILIKMPAVHSSAREFEDDFRENWNWKNDFGDNNFEFNNIEIYGNVVKNSRNKTDKKDAEKMKKEAEKMKVEAEKMKMEANKQRRRIEQSQDSIFQKDFEQISGIMKDFLVRYGDLAPDLKPQEKIKLIYETRRLYGSFNKNRDDNQNSLSHRIISAEVNKQAIDDLKTNKISEKDFLSKIIMSQISKGDQPQYRDFAVLANIFDKVAISEASFLPIKDTEYTYLEGFGVTFETKLVKSLVKKGKMRVEYLDRETQKTVKIDVDGEKEDLGNFVDDAEGNKIDIKFYEDNAKKDVAAEKEKTKVSMEKIEKDAKEYLILYGRTLRNLKDGEQIVWNIDLGPRWENSNENKIQLSASKTLLSDYDQRKITLEQAISQIQVVKN